MINSLPLSIPLPKEGLPFRSSKFKRGGKFLENKRKKIALKKKRKRLGRKIQRRIKRSR